jgi:hypothetical protein
VSVEPKPSARMFDRLYEPGGESEIKDLKMRITKDFEDFGDIRSFRHNSGFEHFRSLSLFLGLS